MAKKWSVHPVAAWVQIVLGTFIAALAYNLYLVPNNIAPGGFTGIGQLVNALTGLPIGGVVIVLNLPLFLWAAKALGLRFGLRSLCSMLLLSLLLDYMPLPAATGDQMLSAVYGGVIGGVGFGLILRGNATTGGTDMLGALLHKYLPQMRIGYWTFSIDALVVIASGFVFDATSAMFALIAAFLMGQLLDMVLEGPNSARAYFIVSDQSEEIAARILAEMDRGVTAVKGRGMYSGADKLALLCVVGRFESVRLRAIVAQTDPRAFVIATDTREVLGEGFRPHGG